MLVGCHACQSWYCSRCVSGWGESTAVEGMCEFLVLFYVGLALLFIISQIFSVRSTQYAVNPETD